MKDARIAKLPRLALILGGTFALLMLGAATFASRPAEANQAIAQKTGKGCSTCHTAPPALNGTGKRYMSAGKL
jgi:hypothetical protein